MRWIIDGNNVFGSRPDGWWNDRPAAATRLAQRIAEWCRTHDDDVCLVFDPPLDPRTAELAGGNLTIDEAPRRGRDAADDHIVSLVDVRSAAAPHEHITVATSDAGLRARLPDHVDVVGVGRFRDLIGY